MTAAGVACAACGFELPPTAKFCLECGTPIAAPEKPAEYKQVTVLFADVVHSMDIAAAVGPERLREIMTELLERSALVVERYGGTVNQFTGDGIMAVFGAPISLEDHALRACLTAMGVQREAERLAADVKSRDGVTLQLRIGPRAGTRRDRPVGRRSHRSRIRAARRRASEVACAASARSRRHDRVSRSPRSLSTNGRRSWLRRTHLGGRGDALTVDTSSHSTGDQIGMWRRFEAVVVGFTHQTRIRLKARRFQ